MSFFDTTPMGRITSRLSKDQDTLDGELPMMAMQVRYSMFCCRRLFTCPSSLSLSVLFWEQSHWSSTAGQVRFFFLFCSEQSLSLPLSRNSLCPFNGAVSLGFNLLSPYLCGNQKDGLSIAFRTLCLIFRYSVFLRFSTDADGISRNTNGIGDDSSIWRAGMICQY